MTLEDNTKHFYTFRPDKEGERPPEVRITNSDLLQIEANNRGAALSPEEWLDGAFALDNMNLTERDLHEIQLCLFYGHTGAHGTAGHNRMVLIGKMARALGMTMESVDEQINQREEWRNYSLRIKNTNRSEK